MTAAEAREIDRLEFEAERAAIRQRALAIVQAHKAQAKARAEALASLSPQTIQPQPALNSFNCAPVGPRGKVYTHAGLTLPLKEWAGRLGVPMPRLAYRLRQGWPLHEVLTSQNHRGKGRPGGVVADLGPIEGTGARSTAQEMF